jgi:hypothetical protein
MTSHVVVIGPKVKSWAIGLEISCTLAQSGKDVLLLDFSNFERHWPFSLRRHLLQFKLTTQYKIKVQKVRRRKVYNSNLLLSDYCTVDELTRLKFQGFEIGHVVVASLYARFGSASLELSQVEWQEVQNTVAIVVDVLDSVLKLQVFENSSLEEVIVFNGREPIEASCLLIAKQMNLQTRISERASTSDKYCLYTQSPHTNSEWWDKIWKFDQSVKTGAIVLSEQKREAYKAQKSKGFDPFQGIKWRQFMDSDQKLDLPSSKYVVFYSVSTGEVSPFLEFDTKAGFPDQFTALEDLIEVARSMSLMVVIRRHPNSLGRDGVDRESSLWAKFKNLPHVKYFGPTERVDSYVLAKGAYCCFTWRSTIGFDTLCLGIPSYSLGPSKWALDQSLRTWDKAQLAFALNSPKLPSVKLVNLYADYMSHFGEQLTFFQKIERWGYVSSSGKRVFNFLFQRLLIALRFWSPKN